MAKYVIEDNTLTNIADSLRELWGDSDLMTTADMTNVGQLVSEEVQLQASLLQQIRSKLEAKR